MLLRFIIKNLYSFKDQTEFNLFPGKAHRLKHHKYKKNDIEILKLSALYGANGSGKSNLIKAIAQLKDLIETGKVSVAINNQRFKLSKQSQNEPVELGMEFYCNPHFYYYTISILDNVIIDEYFGESGKDTEEERLIFHRKMEQGKLTVQFFKEFEEDVENAVLGRVIAQDLLKPDQVLFSLLNDLSNTAFSDIRNAKYWLSNNLQILFPKTSVHHIAQELDTNKKFRLFANELLCSFNTGISDIKVDVKNIEEFLGEDNQKQLETIEARLKNIPGRPLGLITDASTGEEVSIVNENGKIVAKRLYFEHPGERNESVEFGFGEESDGTRRLLEYIPALSFLINTDSTFIVDEIERSIHPLIIKELIAKFSADQDTRGQLIFSTHESNLLDQDIFRTDEIWFAEKNKAGASKLYSLSDFKEHNTIDIRKGYLNGRYGAVPFLGNLEDLNWNKYSDAKPE